MKPRDWLAKVDLKDAYFSIPIHRSHKQYLKFIFPENLPIQLPALRPVIDSVGLYQDPEASTSPPLGNGGQADSLYRRYR